MHYNYVLVSDCLDSRGTVYTVLECSGCGKQGVHAFLCQCSLSYNILTVSSDFLGLAFFLYKDRVWFYQSIGVFWIFLKYLTFIGAISENDFITVHRWWFTEFNAAIAVTIFGVWWIERHTFQCKNITRISDSGI